MAMTLHQLAEKINARVEGDGDRTVDGCAPIISAGPNDVAFLVNRRYAKHLAETKAAAVLIAADEPCPEYITRLVCDDPYYSFRNALIAFYGFREHPAPAEMDERGVSPRASVHPTATISASAQIHPFAVVDANVKIGRDCVLYPGVYIGEETTVGDGCIFHANVTVYDRCVIGDRVTLHSSTVVGQDGFGYATHKGAHHKIPQTGNVVIEDDVELGAGCAIERAAMGETRIGAGSKFADLISIGHGTTLGKHCLLVSLVGIAGSAEVGDYVVLGGQAAVTGHLTVGSGVQAAARAAIVNDVPPGKKVGGAPAIELRKSNRNAVAMTNLHDLFKRVKQLEKQVEALGGDVDPV